MVTWTAQVAVQVACDYPGRLSAPHSWSTANAPRRFIGRLASVVLSTFGRSSPKVIRRFETTGAVDRLQQCKDRCSRRRWLLVPAVVNWGHRGLGWCLGTADAHDQ